VKAIWKKGFQNLVQAPEHSSQIRIANGGGDQSLSKRLRCGPGAPGTRLPGKWALSARHTAFADGGAGAEELARRVVEIIEKNPGVSREAYL